MDTLLNYFLTIERMMKEAFSFTCYNEVRQRFIIITLPKTCMHIENIAIDLRFLNIIMYYYFSFILILTGL